MPKSLVFIKKIERKTNSLNTCCLPLTFNHSLPPPTLSSGSIYRHTPVISLSWWPNPVREGEEKTIRSGVETCRRFSAATNMLFRHLLQTYCPALHSLWLRQPRGVSWRLGRLRSPKISILRSRPHIIERILQLWWKVQKNRKTCQFRVISLWKLATVGGTIKVLLSDPQSREASEASARRWNLEKKNRTTNIM